MKLIFVSQLTAVVWGITSLCGVIFLLGLGSLYHTGYEELIEGKNAPPDPAATARGCFISALVFAALAAFFLFQSIMHKKEAERESRFAGI
ncbi:hypothetical protein BASA50_006726 [Batrachochytrium salamandrivorans]|uniref:Uncharacterized protein n=1 Tax=Batrachochytrium salamandrivorans TaxID=1357716 RepID=A0ABQ8F8W9_9FUNG|nr:hypothetical protein BASA60_006895 [Batrachochytrium salamandrivorans]KAH6576441.1 hypothetical protein BASA62_001362 [Batrachochytrium salamandrivorans]KAH6590480.1 hypothetical protein BASA61_005239 [Batrachochytrium salamandrivorans]KAH6594254.1 hypothetical protein BASA50_006726 [Batrachochytrium salamandrivorans]KAH9270063.1 hypothetical protein BASA83_007893 [Batrachochytrium salamandrivorans]